MAAPAAVAPDAATNTDKVELPSVAASARGPDTGTCVLEGPRPVLRMLTEVWVSDVTGAVAGAVCRSSSSRAPTMRSPCISGTAAMWMQRKLEGEVTQPAGASGDGAEVSRG